MKQLYEDLWISTPEALTESGQGEIMHGFLLRHPRGNIVVSRIENLNDHQFIANEGGVIRHYLTHWHEAGPGARALQQRFSSALYCHIRALGPISRFVEADDTFSQAEVHGGSFHVVPTPGHTPGSASYLYASPYGKTYLFVGDTVTFMHDRWVTVVEAESNEADLANSLEFYRALRPDVVLMGTTGEHPGWAEVTIRDWLALLDEAETTPLERRQRQLN